LREQLGHFAREWVAVLGRAERDLDIKGKNFFLFFSFLREQNPLVFMIKEREKGIERGSLAQGTAVRWCKFLSWLPYPTQQPVNSFYEPSGASNHEKKSVPCGAQTRQENFFGYRNFLGYRQEGDPKECFCFVFFRPMPVGGSGRRGRKGLCFIFTFLH